MAKDRVTIKDVADLASVTAQTVSRVIRNQGYVSEETKKRVMEAVRALNYIPSYAATALRNGMSPSIAIVFDSLRNIYFAVMLDYLRQTIVNHGYSVQLIFSEEFLITEKCYHEAISHGAVAVISFLESEEGLGETVKSCGVPLMVFGRTTEEKGLDYITTDDKQGGAIAAQYLLREKCTEFKYVVEGKGLTCALDRFEGFSNELAAHGYKAQMVDVGTYGDAALADINFNDPNVGIFCFNDILAFRVLNRMDELNLGVKPKIVGYDNIASDLVLPVKLASVGIDKAKHAEFAVSSFIRKFNHPEIVLAEHQAVRLFE